MSFEKLIGLVGDNPEALEVIKLLETASTSNVGKINELELKVSNIAETRDKYKLGNDLVKKSFGIENINDETIAELLKSKGNKDNEAELQNLKQQIELGQQERADIETSYKSKLSDIALKNALSKTGLAQRAINPEVYEILEGIALKGAVYEDDKIIFKNDDKSTKYVNGKPMSLSDRVDELSKSTAYSTMFHAEGTGGGGASNSTNNKSVNTSSMSATQMMNEGRK